MQSALLDVPVMDSSFLSESQRAFLQIFVLLLMTTVLTGQAKWWTCSSSRCGRCLRRVTPMEELIVQFYPGLFSASPPVSAETASIGIKTFGSLTLNSGSAEIPRSLNGHGKDPNDRGLSSITSSSINSRSSRNNNHSTWRSAGDSSRTYRKSYVASHTAHLSSMGCCETIMEYVTPPNVTVGDKVYQVVHLSQAFQFIPVGRCRPGSTCSLGECVDQYRAHWVLIYNRTENAHGPPVNFSPVEVPSHCECINVGRP